MFVRIINRIQNVFLRMVFIFVASPLVIFEFHLQSNHNSSNGQCFFPSFCHLPVVQKCVPRAPSMPFTIIVIVIRIHCQYWIYHLVAIKRSVHCMKINENKVLLFHVQSLFCPRWLLLIVAKGTRAVFSLCFVLFGFCFNYLLFFVRSIFLIDSFNILLSAETAKATYKENE